MGIWLAGNRITATKLNLYSAHTEDTTSRTTTSTTYADASGGALSVSVTVPPSGIVEVFVRDTKRNSGANNSITSWTGVGSVTGTVYSANDNAAMIVGGTSNVSLMLSYRQTGLTAGETFTVTIKHRVNTASTLTVDYRFLSVKGIQ